MATLKLENINKVYDNNVQAVFDFNLEIKDEEFIVFVGPSGCGKSTTLRMIAGLENITSGNLFINEKRMNDVGARQRKIAMVFQNYALYPHMTVYDNLAFSLKMNKVPKKEIEERVQEVATLLEIEDYLKRKPKALSGGQRQRVALGRAIIRDADVYLMDEPLSNLDAKLRIQMRTEIIRLHEKLKTTTIYVTHDQTEAMTMATRLVVMHKGYIQQIGTPEDVYRDPINMFVAGFLGSPSINFLPGLYKEGVVTLDNGLVIEIPEMAKNVMNTHVEKRVVLGIRPEDIYIEDIVKNTFPTAVFNFEVEVREMLGNEYIVYGNIEGTQIAFKTNVRSEIHTHQYLEIGMDLSKLHIFDEETEANLLYELY